MGKKKIDPNTKASPEIEALMKRIIPTFGSQNQLDIMAAHEEILNLITLMNSAEDRAIELKKVNKQANKARDEIRKKEEYLLFLLKKEELSPEIENHQQNRPQETTHI